MPSYVDPSDEADILPGDINAVNRIFGRRLAITSFRLLSPNEI
jgi:hypothetical protein